VRRWPCIDQPTTRRLNTSGDHGQVEKPVLLGRQIGNVGDPEPIWTRSSKAALDQIGSWRGGGIAPSRAHVPPMPTMTPNESSLAHEPGDPVVPAGQPACSEFGLHPQGPVGATALLMNLSEVCRHLDVGAAASCGLAPAPRERIRWGRHESTRPIRRTG
jgi:hypothetical protein